MNSKQRQSIKIEIDSLEKQEKHLNAPNLYLLKRMRLQGKLDWDDYLKGIHENDNNDIYMEIQKENGKSTKNES